MKTKIIIFLAASAAVTLSFTFVSVRGKDAVSKTSSVSATAQHQGLSGGLIIEEGAF
jgi:hypothetical protein